MTNVRIVEVGPRDGLQAEARIIPTADKIHLVDLLTACGFETIEVASFVNPKAVPQMADGAAVCAGIARGAGVTYAALTPNMRGYEAAVAAGVDEVAVFASASEGFSRANINASIEESLARFAPIAEAARDGGPPVRAYISCATDCPYDGPTPPEAVARLLARLDPALYFEVCLADTIGKGTPERVGAMLDAALAVRPATGLACHFHDTTGLALANIEAALDKGIRVFDASVAGLGGCPFAPGAPGNVATEAVVDRVEALGFDTGLDRARLAEAAGFARGLRP